MTDPRYVAFVDDLEGLREVVERFGRHNVVAVSAKTLGLGVQRWTRETLASDMQAVVDAHRARPFAAVVNFHEPYVIVAARLSERLGLPTALPDPLLARDKLRMKDALRPFVRCAGCIAIRGPSDLEAASPSFFPGVLKPRYGFASLCAVRVDDAPAARRELREKRDKLRTTHLERVDLGVPLDSEFVLESFVGGSEHTVESFVAAGEVVLQIVSDKCPMIPPHFVETGDVMPSFLGEEDQDRLRETARRAIAALGIVHGWTHAELKLLGGEAWVMEIGARMGGGYTRDLVKSVYGLDLLRAQLDYVASGVRPALGPPQGVVMGRRTIVSGLSIVWDARAIARPLGDSRVTLVARESSPRRRGVFLGVPYSYAGTVAAYLVHARDAAELVRLNAEIDAAVEPRRVELPVPRSWYRAYLRAKRLLDGFSRS